MASLKSKDSLAMVDDFHNGKITQAEYARKLDEFFLERKQLLHGKVVKPRRRLFPLSLFKSGRKGIR